LEVFARHKELETAREAAAMSEMTLSAAEENLAVVRNRFKEGLLTAADLLDAEASALRAALDRTSAYAELRIASAALDRAVGRLSTGSSR
jgi:outer membrane protein TolC